MSKSFASLAKEVGCDLKQIIIQEQLDDLDQSSLNKPKRKWRKTAKQKIFPGAVPDGEVVANATVSCNAMESQVHLN
jgi:hypothetical protein